MRIFLLIIFLCSSLFSYGANSHLFLQKMATDDIVANHTQHITSSISSQDCQETDLSKDCAISCFFSSSSVLHANGGNFVMPPLIKGKAFTGYENQAFVFSFSDIFRPPPFLF